MKLDLIFHGAVEGNIGGNAVVARFEAGSKSYQYLFDFGVDSRRYHAIKTLGLEPKCLDDFLHRKLVREFDLAIQACFISHAHPDHYGALKVLCESKYSPFPVWMSKTTSRIIGKGINFHESPLHRDPLPQRIFYENPSSTSDQFHVRIMPYPVDHDIPGACAYFILTDKSLIIYSGDFRDSGVLSSMMKNQFWIYANEIAGTRKKILITEGTNFGLPYSYNSDSDFKLRIGNILDTYGGQLVVVIVKESASWDIVVALKAIEEQKSNKRKVVLSGQISRFWSKIGQSFEDDYKNVVDDPRELMIHRHLKPGKHLMLDLNDSESAPDLMKEIAYNPGGYFIFATRKEALKIMDNVTGLRNKGGGCCVFNASMGDEAVEESLGDFAQAIADLGFSLEDTNSTARGHISPHRLVDIINTLDPELVLVMHTLRPKGLTDFLTSRVKSRVLAPTFGQPIEVE